MNSGTPFKPQIGQDFGKEDRWMSQDPLGFSAGDSNLYRYVTNSPILNSDPLGHFNIPLSPRQWINRGIGGPEASPGLRTTKVVMVETSFKFEKLGGFKIIGPDPCWFANAYVKKTTTYQYYEDVYAVDRVSLATERDELKDQISNQEDTINRVIKQAQQDLNNFKKDFTSWDPRDNIAALIAFDSVINTANKQMETINGLWAKLLINETRIRIITSELNGNKPILTDHIVIERRLQKEFTRNEDWEPLGKQWVPFGNDYTEKDMKPTWSIGWRF
jgi:hypothetical protein